MKYAVTLASLAVALFVGIQVYQFALERAENKNTAPEPQPMAVEIMQPGKRAVEASSSPVWNSS